MRFPHKNFLKGRSGVDTAYYFKCLGLKLFIEEEEKKETPPARIFFRTPTTGFLKTLQNSQKWATFGTFLKYFQFLLNPNAPYGLSC